MKISIVTSTFNSMKVLCNRMCGIRGLTNLDHLIEYMNYCGDYLECEGFFVWDHNRLYAAFDIRSDKNDLNRMGYFELYRWFVGWQQDKLMVK